MVPSSYAGGASFITNSCFSATAGHFSNLPFSWKGFAIGISGTGLEVGGEITMAEIGSGILSGIWDTTLWTGVGDDDLLKHLQRLQFIYI